ncbi:MAG: outer membrane protein transport protein [bacterium]
MKSCLISCAVLIVILAGTGAAQTSQDYEYINYIMERPFVEGYHFDFTGGGARAEGMGKAFIAVSDDITAGSWNPAGLYVQEKPIISLSWASLDPRGSTNSNVFEGSAIFDHSGRFSGISAFSFIAPLRIKGHHFVGSFSLTRNFDEFQGDGFVGHGDSISNIAGQDMFNVSSDFHYVSELQGGLNSVNIGFGTRVYRNLSFGASMNVYTGKMVRDQYFDAFERWVSLKPDVVDSRRITGHATILDTSSFSGYNVNIGFKLKGEALDVGLVVRTPFSLNINTGRSIYTINRRAALDQGQLVTVGSDTVYFDDLLTKYSMPLMIGAGVVWRASEKWLLATDIEYRGFSSGQVERRDSLRIDPGGSNEEYYTKIDPRWNDVFTVRLGTEYLHQTGIGLIPLRAGFGYLPTPAPSIDVDGRTSSAVNYNLSLGFGIHWNQIHLDWGYTYSIIDWEMSDQYEPVNDPDQPRIVRNRHNDWAYTLTKETWEDTDPSVIMEQKNRNHHLSFTFTGYF